MNIIKCVINLDLTKSLIRRGQIEIISGGFFEPIMSAIPEEDRKSQINLNKDILRDIFDVKAKGIWLAERVWTPELLETLNAAELEYVVLDDTHVLKSERGEKNNAFAPCETESYGKKIKIIPASTKLRYMIPYNSPEKVISYFEEVSKNNNGDVCLFFADDGEKFGAWNNTYNFVHKRGWLKKFLNSISKNRDWISTHTLEEIINTHQAKDIGEIPDCSYSEMMNWSSGNFENFVLKYPEIKRMNHRMLGLSKRISDREKNNLCGSSVISEAKEFSLKSQTNCAYWHGAFGGGYLPHLREGVYSNIMKAESLLEKEDLDEKNYVKARFCDIGDEKETSVTNKYLNVFTDPDNGAVVTEIDFKKQGTNITNTFSRIEEKYHNKLSKGYGKTIRRARLDALKGKHVNIHDILGVKEKGLNKILCYDKHRKSNFQTHIVFDKKKTIKDIEKGCSSDFDILTGKYDYDIASDNGFVTQSFKKKHKFICDEKEENICIKKEIVVGKSSAIMFSHTISGIFTNNMQFSSFLEFNFLIWDKKVVSRPRLTRNDKFSLQDMYSGVILDVFMDKEVDIFLKPIYTVNETDTGMGKTYQGISVILGEKVVFVKNRKEKHNLKVSLAIG